MTFYILPENRYNKHIPMRTDGKRKFQYRSEEPVPAKARGDGMNGGTDEI